MAGNFDPLLLGRYILSEVLTDPFDFGDYLQKLDIAQLRTANTLTHTRIAPLWKDLVSQICLIPS